MKPGEHKLKSGHVGTVDSLNRHTFAFGGHHVWQKNSPFKHGIPVMCEKVPFLLTIFLLCILSGKVLSQQNAPGGQALESLIEWFSEEAEEDSDMAQWLEELYVLFENPLNINTASTEELLRIPFLNEVLAANIIDHRSRSGSLASLFELASVKGIDRSLAEKISLFVTVSDETLPSSSFGQARSYGRHQLLVKGWQSFPRPAGYFSNGDKPPAFQGDAQKLYARYLYSKGNILQAGITGDRDPGEEFFKGSNPYGFDFLSAHVGFRVSDLVPQVIVGDFLVRAGQGLLLWQGFTMGKSAEVLGKARANSQIRPYTSTDENFFFRGIAATLNMGSVRSHVFVSRKKSDGNQVTDEEDQIAFTSLQTSGYHRTLSEIEDKNSVRHTVSGITAGYSHGLFYLGSQVVHDHFKYPFVRGTQLYQKFMFSGKENLNVSVDYRYIPGRLQLYGEAALSASGGYAFIQGLEGRLHDQVNLSMVFRHYARHYQSTWGSAFGENTRNANETGLYIGVRVFPFAGFALSGYGDWFRFPWLNYGTAGPSVGHDYLLQGDWKLSRRMAAYIRIRNKSKATKVKSEKLYQDERYTRTSLRLNFRYQINEHFFIRNRYEISGYTLHAKEGGYLLYQDAGWAPERFPISLTLRYAYFRTDGYNARIYAYENDLLYNFSTVSVFGEGIRAYLNLRYKLTGSSDIWMKAGQTRYFDRDEISSGHSKIGGNRKSEFKIQYRYRF